LQDPALTIIELAAGKRCAAKAIAATMPGGLKAHFHTTSSAAKVVPGEASTGHVCGSAPACSSCTQTHALRAQGRAQLGCH